MAKVLVLYYSAYGHIEKMAEAVAEGAHGAGAQGDIKRVPETVPADVAKASHFKLDQKAPVAAVADLEHYDAIIVSTGTRYGRLSSQMAAFVDQTGGLWMRGALNGKVGAAFASTATQHGGQEMTLFSIIANLMHLGLVIVGLPNSHQGQMSLSEIVGGAPTVPRPSPAATDRVSPAPSSLKAPGTGSAGRQDGNQAVRMTSRTLRCHRQTPRTGSGSHGRASSRLQPHGWR